jgi:hypothetical protein
MKLKRGFLVITLAGFITVIGCDRGKNEGTATEAPVPGSTRVPEEKSSMGGTSNQGDTRGSLNDNGTNTATGSPSPGPSPGSDRR